MIAKDSLIAQFETGEVNCHTHMMRDLLWAYSHRKLDADFDTWVTLKLLLDYGIQYRNEQTQEIIRACSELLNGLVINMEPGNEES